MATKLEAAPLSVARVTKVFFGVRDTAAAGGSVGDVNPLLLPLPLLLLVAMEDECCCC